MIGKPLLALVAAPLLLSNAEGFTIPSPFFVATEAIPQIQCFSPAGGHRGTGFRISDDVLISARHVTNGSHSCSAEGKPLTLAHSKDDFAANKINPDPGLRLVVSCAGIKEGQDYFALGYAFGGKLVMERLVGTSRRDGSMVRMNGRVYGGMSGGPIIDDQGRPVAVINQRLTEISQANVHPLSETYLCNS